MSNQVRMFDLIDGSVENGIHMQYIPGKNFQESMMCKAGWEFVKLKIERDFKF